jgi:hypothetical protein
MLVNTEYFRLPAKHYEKYGRYDDGAFGTTEYLKYWTEEIRRCKYGYKVGDTWISGYHYFYLNYWRIMLVEKNESGLVERDERNSHRQKADRIESFPAFWDVDYEFFQEIERAEQNGEHFVWLKPRGVGASFKGSSMAGRNMFLYKKSKTFLIADEKEYLTKDGIITKFVDGREFLLRAHPIERDRFAIGFAKPSDFKKSLSDMHWRASTKHPETGEEIGYMSEVIGISVKDDTEKSRGKRGKLLIYEEMGKFPDVDVIWNINRRGVEEGDSVYGLMLGFGTGGSTGANFQAFEKMFYNPKAFNIRCFDNIWDDNAFGTKCAYFTAGNRIIDFKDKDGNSDVKKGDAFIGRARKEAADSPDPNTLLQVQAELPLKPQEAILSTGYKILPSQAAREWRLIVEATKDWQLGVPGILENTGNGVNFFPNKNTHPPIMTFPHNAKDDLHGCVVIYHFPVKDRTGKIPDNLYIIGHDPYAQDKGGESIGATYVWMNANNLYPPGDKLVATFFGRPPTQDDYNKILFDLAEYYNAMIGFENDQGDVVGYAKRFKKLHMLQPEFECGWDEQIKTKAGGRRSYGMNIGSGRENKRKLQGDKYVRDSLLTPRGKLTDGKFNLNLHTIYCLYTLRQIELYNLEGNFDGIAAMRILEYFKKEMIYKDLKPEANKVFNRDSLFNRPLFK